MTRIYIAASGTGGHLLPAVYIAEELRKMGHEIIFFTSGRPLEAKLLKDFSRVNLPTSGVAGLGLSGALKFLITAPRATFIITQEFIRYKPKAVVGVGGYISVLPVILGRLLRIKTLIHEAESHFGLANRLLRFIARKITSAHPNLPGAVYTGHPVRSSLKAISPNTCIVPRKLLVLGGSQGAQTLDLFVPQIIPEDFEVHHQAREENITSVQEAYSKRGIKAKVVPFFDQLSSEYSWCDLIISRAGAGSVMEISFTNRPTIFVPFPFAQANHQKDNAERLKEKSLIVEEGEGFKERLEKAIRFISISENYVAMRDAEFVAPPTDAALRIAQEVIGD